jgi:hypothetical protein
MPTFTFNDDVSFKYGTTWRVDPTPDPQLVELVQPQVRYRDGVPLHRWWIRWCRADTAAQAWQTLAEPPDPRYQGLAVWDRWGQRADPATVFAQLTPTHGQVGIGEYFKGPDPAGGALAGFVEARFYFDASTPAASVVGLGILVFGELDMMLRRMGTARFAENLEYAPWLACQDRARAEPAEREKTRSSEPAPLPRPTPPVSARPAPVPRPPAVRHRLCGVCGGAGRLSCSTCGGSGYRTQSASRTNGQGRVEYYQEQVPCWGCTGGRVSCGRCGGTGQVLGV